MFKLIRSFQIFLNLKISEKQKKLQVIRFPEQQDQASIPDCLNTQNRKQII